MADNEQPILNRQKNFFSSEQIDGAILGTEAKATVITRKKPNIIKTPIYLVDEAGEKIPMTDEKGKTIINEFGEIQYIIKGYDEKQVGWIAKQELMTASEPFSTDNSTSYTTSEEGEFLARTYWFYNFLSVQNDKTDSDYSGYLNKLRNDANALLQSKKSVGGQTVKAVKTIYTKSEGTQVLRNEEVPVKKKGFFAKLWPFGK